VIKFLDAAGFDPVRQPRVDHGLVERRIDRKRCHHAREEQVPADIVSGKTG